MSVASCGNDHRLGADEAPPAIVSILGDQLTEVVEMSSTRQASVHATTDTLDFGAVSPRLKQDNTDRNRTSPFAFTNNKFEFRAVGSEANVSDSEHGARCRSCQALRDFADALEGTAGEDFQERALAYCAEHLRAPPHPVLGRWLFAGLARRGRRARPVQLPHHRRRAARLHLGEEPQALLEMACSPRPRPCAATR